MQQVQQPQQFQPQCAISTAQRAETGVRVLAVEAEPAARRMERVERADWVEERGLAAAAGGAAALAGLPTTVEAGGSAPMGQSAPALAAAAAAGHSAMDQLASQRWVAMAVLAEDHKTAAEGQQAQLQQLAQMQRTVRSSHLNGLISQTGNGYQAEAVEAEQQTPYYGFPEMAHRAAAVVVAAAVQVEAMVALAEEAEEQRW